MGHGGPGRGQGRKRKRGLLRPYERREAIGKLAWKIGWCCRDLRQVKLLRSRDDIIEQVAGEFKVSTARVDRCWKQVNQMLGDLHDEADAAL